MYGRGLDGVSQASLRRGLNADEGLKEKPPPLHGTWAVMKLSSPQHAQNTPKSAFLRLQGELFRGRADEGAVLGEVFRGWGVGGVCRANFFPEQPRNRLCRADVISDRTGNQFAGPATARHERMGMKKHSRRSAWQKCRTPTGGSHRGGPLRARRDSNPQPSEP